MTPCLLYLVPPVVSRSSTVNLQSLIEGLTEKSSTDGPEFRVEVAMLGKRHLQLQQWLDERGIRTHILPARGSVDVALFLRIRRFLLRLDPELVHVWEGGLHLGVWVSALFGAERVLVDQPIPDCVLPGRAKTFSSSVMPVIKRKLAEQTQALVERFDPTDLTAAKKRPVTEHQPTNSHIISPGVRIPTELHAINNGVEVRASLGLSPDAELIGISCAFRRGGGGKDAIWAADLLKCVRDHTHVLLFGDGPLRWRLDRFRWQTETEDRVHFVDESRFAELVPHLFCFWQPAHTAGGVQSLLSSMAAGVPVVASDLPSHRQLINDGDTGLLVTPGNRGSLARKTDLLLRDDQLRAKIRLGAREHAVSHFTIDHQIDSYSRLYNEILASPLSA